MLTSREATEVPRLGTGYPFIAANIKSKLRSRSPQNAQHFTSIYCVHTAHETMLSTVRYGTVRLKLPCEQVPCHTVRFGTVRLRLLRVNG